jgi:putative Holliday junction resolvase
MNAAGPGQLGPGVRPGVRLGVDVGAVRVGVARSDPRGELAVPVETVRRGPGDVARVRDLVNEYEVVEVIVGLPLTLAGERGVAADHAVAFAQELVAVTGAVSVRLVDERLSTVAATRQMQAAGRDSRSSRKIIDQVAAVVILQQALDTERATGKPPGIDVPLGA